MTGNQVSYRRDQRLRAAATASLTALLWVGTFYLNDWVFAATEKTHFVNLVFLPAGVRILSVLVFGWPAVIGLFLGSVVTAIPFWHLPAALVPALISSSGPAAAVLVGRHSMSLQEDLQGIQPRQMAFISMADGAFNSLPSNLFFWLQGRVASPWQDVPPMFVGDLLGTFLLLYLGAVSVRLLLRWRSSSG